ncbi:hypothetical protein DVH24_007033 [Malus domestica]|uniref:Protein kinase domain-containing protein n=1 Tax=Malus domestica TaxID=3750 RepID=A0A498HK62_MALDO|nr:hypothetical protein DVH24_007033 [Malus domestica]
MPQQSSFTCTSFLTSALPHSHSPDIECVLDVQDSSAWHGTSCEAGNWGGFISNCCEQLSMITYAPWGTGQLFLNSTEQTNCLISMKGIKDDVLSCGIDKITSGAGGCSDYTKVDDQARSACLRRWEEIVALTENEESSKLEADMSLHETLGDQRLSEGIGSQERQLIRFIIFVFLLLLISALLEVPEADEQRSSGSSGINLSTGQFCGFYVVVQQELQQYYSLQHGPYEIFSTKRWYLFLQLISYLTTNPTVVNCCYPFFYWTASDDLPADNFIDQGRAGKVYKGILSNGKHVAVKHIINNGSVETFICEVTSLPDVRHPNLVALLGSCEGVEENFLVYELCQNGDLSEWLFGKDKSLSWITRLELAIDSAGGLWLLQTYPRGCIVLRDIKVALNFLHFFCLHRRCCFISHSFHQISFLATFPTGSQQTFSLTKTFKRNCQTSSYLKLWTWDSPMRAQK